MILLLISFEIVLLQELLILEVTAMITPFDDTYFMKKALQEAEAALEKGEVPVGAVIVVEDRIIG